MIINHYNLKPIKNTNSEWQYAWYGYSRLYKDVKVELEATAVERHLEIDCFLSIMNDIKKDNPTDINIEVYGIDCLDFRTPEKITSAYFDPNTFSIHKKYDKTWEQIGELLNNNNIEHMAFVDTACYYFRIKGDGSPYGCMTFDNYIEAHQAKLNSLTNDHYELMFYSEYSSRKCGQFFYKKIRSNQEFEKIRKYKASGHYQKFVQELPKKIDQTKGGLF